MNAYGIALMWNITLADIHRAKGQLQARRAKIEAKYLEEIKTLDADLAEIETLERVASDFALKHQAAEGFAEAGRGEAAPASAAALDAPDPPASAETSGSGAGKIASRWRLHLDGRSASEQEHERGP